MWWLVFQSDALPKESTPQVGIRRWVCSSRLSSRAPYRHVPSEAMVKVLDRGSSQLMVAATVVFVAGEPAVFSTLCAGYRSASS